MKILIVKPGGIGDTLLLFPALVELKKRHPYADIDVIGNRAPLELFLPGGHVSSASSIDDRRASRLLYCIDDSAVASIRAYDRHIYLVDDDGTIAHNLDTAGVVDYLIASGTQQDTNIPQWRHLLGICGCEQTMAEAEYCRAFMRHREYPSTRSGIVIHPGSGSRGKNWPAPRFIELIDFCLASSSDVITLVMGYSEAHLQHEFDSLRGNHRVVFFIDMPLPDLLSLIGGARMYCGNDSGIAHLSGLTGTPSVVLFGPSDPMVWRPIGDQVRVIRSPGGVASMEAISAEAVMVAIQNTIRMDLSK